MASARSSTRRTGLGALIVMVVTGSVMLAAGAALAGTETPPSASVPVTDTDFVRTVAIDQFDPAGGTLTSVTIELAASVVGDVYVENLSTQSRGIGSATLAARVALSLQANPAIAVAPARPTVTQTFRLAACDTPDPATGTGCDEMPDFGGPAGLIVIGLADQDIQTATFTDPTDLALFVGTGTMAFDVVANGNSTGTENNGNVFFQFRTRASADVTVTYQFDAPAIDIEKTTNGEDADTPTGPQIPVGDPVTWTYVVTNTGDVDLTNVIVTDDQGVAVTCPQDALIVGETMTCTATGVAEVGQYANIGTAEGTAPDGAVVTDTDPSHYIGTEVIVEAPAIDIEKATNGEDADTPTGPQIPVGDPVTWTYVVTNTGDVDLTNVTVTDDQGVAVTCPPNTLAVGQSMTCDATGTATAGQYANIGTAEGTAPDSTVVTDTDPSHYIGAPRGGVQQLPSIEIVKNPATQTLVLGSGDDTANFTISVTNTGLVDLINVVVTDAFAPGCSATIGDLAAGEVSTYACSLSGVTAGFTNIAVVSGEDAAGNTVTDSDEAIVTMHLPATGSATGRQAMLGVLALGLGGALLLTSRRRRTHG